MRARVIITLHLQMMVCQTMPRLVLTSGAQAIITSNQKGFEYGLVRA